MLFRSHGFPFAETHARPLVVAPLLQLPEALLLWEDNNQWRHAWAELPPPDGLVPLIAPLGDLADAATVTAEQAASGDAERLAALARRYDAAGVLVAIARVEPADGRPVAVGVTLARAGAEGGDLPGSERLAVNAGEDWGGFLRRIAAMVVEQVEEQWKSDLMLRLEREARLVAVVQLKTLRDWLAVRQQLAGVAAVRKSELLSLGRGEAVVEITFIGDENQLRLALAQRNLSLSAEGGQWRLQASGSP